MPSFTKVVAAVAGCSAIVNGAVIPAENGLHTTTLQTRDTTKGTGHILSKREPVTIAILTAAGTAAVTAIVSEAVSAAAAFIGDISNFDAGREAFTVQTTETMMANNPDPERFQAAACYNKAFSVADPANIDGQSSVEFRLGILNTDYECMYIAAPNQFFTEGDGGLINTYEANKLEGEAEALFDTCEARDVSHQPWGLSTFDNLRHTTIKIKYSTITLTLATILAVFASFGAIDARSVTQDHTAPPTTTLVSSRGVHRATLFTCPAPAFITYPPWIRGVNSYTDEDGNMNEMMTELPETFHRVKQLLVEILAVWDKISGIISKIAKSVKPPFPGSGVPLAILAIITISKSRLKNYFDFMFKRCRFFPATRQARFLADRPAANIAKERADEGKGGLNLKRAIDGENVLSARDLETGSEGCRGHAGALDAGADINHYVEGEGGQDDGKDKADGGDGN
ncbi:hypothetical protein H9Q73_002897 [Fusarium xylarioides]|nr:hypothetical protein H9Q73_002897 [Fusarium xylarioides]